MKFFQTAKKLVTSENAASIGVALASSVGGGFILHNAASKLAPENKTPAWPRR